MTTRHPNVADVVDVVVVVGVVVVGGYVVVVIVDRSERRVQAQKLAMVAQVETHGYDAVQKRHLRVAPVAVAVLARKLADADHGTAVAGGLVRRSYEGQMNGDLEVDHLVVVEVEEDLENLEDLHDVV